VPVTLLPPSDEKAFFEIAATLIPLLLFGGVIVDRLRPPRDKEWRSWHSAVAFYLPVFGASAILAEITAIQVVVTGHSGDFARISVSLVLVVGMLSTIAVIWLPWIARMRKTSGTHSGGLALLAGALLLVLLSVLTIWVLADSVNVAANTENAARLGKAIERNHDELSALRKDIDARLFRLGGLQEQRLAAAGRVDHTAAKSLRRELERQRAILQVDFSEETRLLQESADLLREHNLSR
jgi:hypothetical protein